MLVEGAPLQCGKAAKLHATSYLRRTIMTFCTPALHDKIMPFMVCISPALMTCTQLPSCKTAMKALCMGTPWFGVVGPTCFLHCTLLFLPSALHDRPCFSCRIALPCFDYL